MTDIKIPHTNLPALRRMLDGSIIPADLDVVREFIAAAEADQPPLPEGWVVLELGGGTSRAYYHCDGHLREWTLGTPIGAVGSEKFPRDRLTPLRPTITEADVEKGMAAMRERRGLTWMDRTDGTVRADVEAILTAAGIEVTP